MAKRNDTNHRNQQKSVKGPRRDVNVGLLVRMAQSTLVDHFRALPTWAQRETLTVLNAMVDPTVVTTSVASLGRDAAASKAEITDNEAYASTPSKEVVVDQVVQDDQQQQQTNRVRKLHGFEKPLVKDLPVSQRLAGMQNADRASAVEDLRLLSAALAAVGRAQKKTVSEEDIRRELLLSKESVQNYGRLWPSSRTVRDYALKRCSRRAVGSKPLVENADGVYIVSTTIVVPPLPGPVGEGGDVDLSPVPLVLSRIPFHDGSVLAADLTPALVQNFLICKEMNYTKLKPYLHVTMSGKVLLYWLSFDLSGISWGDDEEISIVYSPTPKVKRTLRFSSDQLSSKKRKLNNEDVDDS